MSTHTPGPWKAEYNASSANVDISGPKRLIAAAVDDFSKGPDTEMEANARLIAAAPELLKHLEHLTGACERFAPHILTSEARATIAKAKGEAS